MPPASSVASRRWRASPRGGSAAPSRRSRRRRRSSGGSPDGSKVRPSPALAAPAPRTGARPPSRARRRPRPERRRCGRRRAGRASPASASRLRMRARSKRSSSLLGSATGSMPAAATISASSARRQPSSGPGDSSARDLRRGADAGQAGQAGAAGEAHHQRLGLVVGMMGGEQPGRSRPPPPIGRAGGSAARGRRTGDCPRSARRRRGSHGATPSACANPGDEAGLVGAFGAEAVIDGGGADPAREGGAGEQQQGEAVRTARDGDAEARRRGAGQRLEIGAEALGQRRRDRHARLF